MRLGELLMALGLTPPDNAGEVEISSIAQDSRRVTPGSLFVCVKGFRDDGHRYIAEATRLERLQGIPGRFEGARLPHSDVAVARECLRGR